MNYTFWDAGLNIFLGKKKKIKKELDTISENIDSKRSNLIIVMKQIMWVVSWYYWTLKKNIWVYLHLWEQGRIMISSLFTLQNRAALSFH